MDNLARLPKYYTSLFVAALFIPHLMLAQEGDYFLTQHSPESDLFDNVNFSIVQDQNSMIWVANRKGIIQYDGVEWALNPTSSAIFHLTIGDDNVIYAGGRNVIGRMKRNENLEMTFQELQASEDMDDILSIGSNRDMRYFLNTSGLFVFNVVQDSMLRFDGESSIEFQDLFLVDDRILVSSKSGQLYEFAVDRFVETKDFEIPNESIYWVEQASDAKLAILTNSGQLWVHSNSMSHIQLDDDNYLAESVPLQMLWVNNDLLAISTLSGGVVFVDVEKSEIAEIINYHTGLPENQVYAMAIDRNHGIWTSHDYGFTRIAPLLPIRSFRNIPGLEGNIQSIINHEGKIYAGTSLGVYYLDEVHDYDEVVYYERSSNDQDDLNGQNARPSSASSTPRQAESDAATEENQEEEGKKKKGLFRFLKKDKDKNQDQDKEEGDAKDDRTKEKDRNKSGNNILSKLFRGKQGKQSSNEEWTRKVKRELLSVRYIFKKVDGIPAKTDQLISMDQGVVAGSLAGMFLITGTSSQRITDIPTRFIHYSSENDLLFGATFSNEVLTFRHENGNWVNYDLLDGLEDIVFQIAERPNEIWLASADSVYRLELDKGELVDVDVLKIENPHFERTFIVEFSGEMMFVNSNGFFVYNLDSRQIELSEEFNAKYGLPERIFLTNDASLWTFDGSNWHIFDNRTGQTDLGFLNIFRDIRQLAYSAETNTYWVVTFNNEIFGLVDPDESKLIEQNSVYLKEIRNKEQILLPTPRLQLQLENQALSFQFIQPDYTGMLGIEYRYRLVGLSDEWSPWSNENNKIEFRYLPAQQYSLELETSDILGNSASIQPIEFKVIPPYWKRSWFYAIEVVLFASLLILSIRLNRGNTRYRFVSRLLAFLTLILIVEFIQTVAEYNFGTGSSPVFGFFIQVGMALLIFPLEILLRKAMFQTQNADLAGELALKAGKKTTLPKIPAKST